MVLLWVVLAVVGYVLFLIISKMRYGRCTSKADMSGKTVIVTGANTGIGYQVALDLATRNARVIMACRTSKEGALACHKIQEETGNKQVIVQVIDLASQASIRDFAKRVNKEEKRIDILINNAGIVAHPLTRTEDGLELNMATNYFGPFLLTMLLLDKLKKSAPSRIIMTTSIAHKWGNINFDNLNAEKHLSTHSIYFDTKLANVLFTTELSRRLRDSGVTVNTLHPGSVCTTLLNSLPLPVWCIMEPIQRLFFRSPEEGAQTTIYLAVSEEVSSVSGQYFSECRKDTLVPKAKDAAVAKKLFEVSERITGLA